MKTKNNFQLIEQMIAYYDNMLGVCNKEIEVLTHPDVYGCCLEKCNSIVLNKERMMVVTTDENNFTTHEFNPLYPTRFSNEVAKRIVENDVFEDCNGNRIKLEIVGKLEYYQLLKDFAVKNLDTINNFVKI